MSLLNRVFGQNNNEENGLLSGLGTFSLRRSYIVVVGHTPPEGEIVNAQEIAKYLRRTLNLSVGAYIPIKSTTPGLPLFSQLANLVIVGGPIANEYAYLMNDYINPKLKITLTRDREPDETWIDFVKDGGLIVDGIICDEVTYDLSSGRGIIGVGKQRFFDKIIVIEGMDYEDTCTMGKAFREGMGAGIYDCTWTDVTHEDPCPPDCEYTLSIEPTV